MVEVIQIFGQKGVEVNPLSDVEVPPLSEVEISTLSLSVDKFCFRRGLKYLIQKALIG